jgi:ATP-dependent DNA helicase DinG
MALAVAATIDSGGALVVEAGTGVGKTFAYLVPALLSGEKVVISTATKTLQDQLFGRDLPSLIKALNLPTRMALLKGRANYVCLYRLAQSRQEGLFPDRYVVNLLAKVERWALTTQTGDLSELQALDERSPLMPMITSTRDNCLGSDCPQYKSCHVALARREALAADVVVINHHLFFADLSMKETGMAELLPNAQVLIFDEAHQLNEIGINFLGEQLSSYQLMELATDLLALGVSSGAGMGEWQVLSSKLELASKSLKATFAELDRGQKLAWGENAPEGLDALQWSQALNDIWLVLTQVMDAIEPLSVSAPEWMRLLERMQAAAALAQVFCGLTKEGCVRWVELGGSVRLVQAPLQIAHIMEPRIKGQASLSSQPSEVSSAQARAQASTELETASPDHRPDGSGPASQDDTLHVSTPGLAYPMKSWIFTSATLGHDAKLSWFTEPCGLQSAQVLQVKSPFDYPKQAVLFVPKGMVLPSHAEHGKEVSELTLKIVRALRGRTLVLTTTLRALKDISERLRTLLKDDPHIEVLAQGEGSKSELMQRFRSFEQGSDEKAYVLVASASFWEGFDVPGDALQAVIIDKLPFPPPNDPMVQAKSKRLEALGQSPFNHYFLAEAAVSLKQGAGRLIRRESDKGVLVVCDTRLSGTGYGKRLMAALPPMARASSEEALLAGLSRLTKASTKV